MLTVISYNYTPYILQMKLKNCMMSHTQYWPSCGPKFCPFNELSPPTHNAFPMSRHLNWVTKTQQTHSQYQSMSHLRWIEAFISCLHTHPVTTTTEFKWIENIVSYLWGTNINTRKACVETLFLSYFRPFILPILIDTKHSA